MAGVDAVTSNMLVLCGYLIGLAAGFTLSLTWNRLRASREAHDELEATFRNIEENLKWAPSRFAEMARDPTSKQMTVDEDRPV